MGYLRRELWLILLILSLMGRVLSAMEEKSCLAADTFGFEVIERVYVQEKKPVDGGPLLLNDILPEEIWSKIMDFLPGDDKALNYFLARVLPPLKKTRENILTCLANYLREKPIKTVVATLDVFFKTTKYTADRNLLRRYFDDVRLALARKENFYDAIATNNLFLFLKLMQKTFPINFSKDFVKRRIYHSLLQGLKEHILTHRSNSEEFDELAVDRSETCDGRCECAIVVAFFPAVVAFVFAIAFIIEQKFSLGVILLTIPLAEALLIIYWHISRKNLIHFIFSSCIRYSLTMLDLNNRMDREVMREFQNYSLA